MSTDLAGRVALITGASKGIGAGIARMLAREGASIAINYNSDRSGASATRAEVEALGAKAAIYECDVGAGYEPVQAMVERAAADFGRLDILVGNSAYNPPFFPVEQLPIEELHRTLNVNFFGAAYCAKAALPHLRKHGRSDIVFISSAMLRDTPPTRSAYCASKGALEAFAKVLSREERFNGIRVNVVQPGLVETLMMDNSIARARGLKSLKEAYAYSPFGRICQPDDIGRTVAFICSAGGDFITGSTLTVDGGGNDWLPPRLSDRIPPRGG